MRPRHLPELTVAENIALPLRLDHRPAGRADIELAEPEPAVVARILHELGERGRS